MPTSLAECPGFERAGRADDEMDFHRIEFAPFLIFRLVRRDIDRASNLFFLFASRADAGVLERRNATEYRAGSSYSLASGHCGREAALRVIQEARDAIDRADEVPTRR